MSLGTHWQLLYPELLHQSTASVKADDLDYTVSGKGTSSILYKFNRFKHIFVSFGKQHRRISAKLPLLLIELCICIALAVFYWR